jgi:hypothetical protein
MPPVDPINITALTAVILGCLTVLIPVAGLTLRYAIKPVAEALAQARQTGGERESIQLLERRMALLEQEVHGVTELRADLVRLLEEMQFRKELKSNP